LLLSVVNFQNCLKMPGNTSASDVASINVTRQTQTNGQVVYTFQDEVAPGLTWLSIDKLFGMFERCTLSADFEGTGLGLANVQYIVPRRHGGRIWAQRCAGHRRDVLFHFAVDAYPVMTGALRPGAESLCCLDEALRGHFFFE
jgi:signal transduction histidine kinase